MTWRDMTKGHIYLRLQVSLIKWHAASSEYYASKLP